jgi:hypothetical protein
VDAVPKRRIFQRIDDCADHSGADELAFERDVSQRQVDQNGQQKDGSQAQLFSRTHGGQTDARSGPHDQARDERITNRGFLGQERKKKRERGEQRPHPPRRAGPRQKRHQPREHEERIQKFCPSDDLAQGFGVDRVNGEEH